MAIAIEVPEVHADGGCLDDLAETFFREFEDAVLLAEGFSHFIERLSEFFEFLGTVKRFDAGAEVTGSESFCYF